MTEPVEHPRPAGDRRRLLVVTAVVVLGLAVTVVGFVALARGPISVGWFAYAPLSEGPIAVSRAWRWAPYLLAGGSLLLGGALGYALGRRRTRV